MDNANNAPNRPNRLKTLFAAKPARILSVFYTAGFPSLTDTITIGKQLADAGADMLEIGMPYSDPMADGPVIQESSRRALENGMSIRLLLEQLAEARARISAPIVLMGYFNPIYVYGWEQFLAEAARIGVDGLIIPDLPMGEYEAAIANHGLAHIPFISPYTPDTRISEINAEVAARDNGDFVYALSNASTTGNKAVDWDTSAAYFERLKTRLTCPWLIGFNIRDKQSFDNACQFSSGAIVGSAFIKHLETGGDIGAFVRAFNP